jgi:hypothetical protein
MWHLDCACGFHTASHSERTILNADQWHKREGCEGCDHVTVIEYRSPGLRIGWRGRVRAER